MDDVVDLDLAVSEIKRRAASWRLSGISVGDVTWREQGEGWPPTLKSDRSQVVDADSIGVQLRKDQQVGEVVLFKGGWCDVAYWSGEQDSEPMQDTPGYPGTLTVESFGGVLDRLAAQFR